MKLYASGGYLTIWYCLDHIIKTHRFAVLTIRSEYLLMQLHMLHGIVNEQGHRLAIRKMKIFSCLLINL